jgi:hypothetical protein
VIFELAHELLPYAAVLYVADSVVRARPGERLIASAWGRRFRWRGPGWHLVGLLPTAEVFVVAAPAVPAPRGSAAASPSGATAPSGAASPFGRAAVPLAPGRAPTVPPSPITAEVEAIRARRAVQAREASALSIAGAVVFIAGFVALPLAVYRRDPTPGPAEAAVAAAAMAWAAVVVLGARALRRAGASWGATLSALSPALFFPPAAAHALSFLRRDAYRPSPPLAVASVLLPPAEFRRLARRELRALDEADRRAAAGDHDTGGHPVPEPIAGHREAEPIAGHPVADPHLARHPLARHPLAAAAGHIDTRAARSEILALLSAAGIDPGEATAADTPRDPAAALFCPLCETEYRSGFAICVDCDAQLIPFAPAVTR